MPCQGLASDQAGDYSWHNNAGGRETITKRRQPYPFDDPGAIAATVIGAAAPGPGHILGAGLSLFNLGLRKEWEELQDVLTDPKASKAAKVKARARVNRILRRG